MERTSFLRKRIEFYILAPVIRDLVKQSKARRKNFNGKFVIRLNKQEIKETLMDKLLAYSLKDASMLERDEIILVLTYEIHLGRFPSIDFWLNWGDKYLLKYGTFAAAYLNESNVEEVFNACRKLREVIYRCWREPDVLAERFKQTPIFEIAMLKQKL